LLSDWALLLREKQMSSYSLLDISKDKPT
jgi:hypothetical protein